MSGSATQGQLRAVKFAATLNPLGVANAEEALSLLTLEAREQSRMLNAVAAEISASRLETLDQVRQRLRAERITMSQRMLRAKQTSAKQSREPER